MWILRLCWNSSTTEIGCTVSKRQISSIIGQAKEVGVFLRYAVSSLSYLLGIKRHPEGVWPVLPGVLFFPDLGGLGFCFFLAECPGDLLGVPLPFNLGVFLYFITRRFDSGVLPYTHWLLATLFGVLGQRRAGERPEPHVLEEVGLVAIICQRSTGAGGTCFSLMSSFSWASRSMFYWKRTVRERTQRRQKLTPLHLFEAWQTADSRILKFPPKFKKYETRFWLVCVYVIEWHQSMTSRWRDRLLYSQ